MSELGVIVIDEEIVVLHMQGRKVELTSDELRDICESVNPAKFKGRKWYQRPIDWHRVLRSNTICHKDYSSQFDGAVDHVAKNNDWDTYQFVVLSLHSGNEGIEAQYFGRPQ